MADTAWRLARALFHAARDAGELEPVGADLARLNAVLRAVPDVHRVVHHPHISEAAKDELLGGAAETELVRRLTAISRQFRQMARQEAGVVKVEVRTAIELAPDDAAALRAALERHFGR